GGGYQGGGYQGGGYEGRGEWNRDDWNQGMGGRWNQGSSRENWRGGGMQGQHAGRGPRSFKRQDDRIEEEINEQLTRHPMIDATDIEVKVQNGEVTMRGHVDSREAKRMAEDIAESVFGVKEVNNQIKIQHHGEQEERRERRAS
ncbi:MAG TPA: BON domain-containing protein, partial [Terriglobia bacterium]|nr:BON domain-containing protein [Terriglobia bacterium]